MVRIPSFAILLLAACGQPADSTAGASPQAVAAAWNRAVRDSDYGTMFELYSPRDRRRLLYCELALLHLLGDGTEVAEELAAIRVRHGLPEPPEHFGFGIGFALADDAIDFDAMVKEFLEPVSDVRALFVDVDRGFRKHVQPEVRYGEPVLWEVEQDRASAFMGGKRVEFSRIGGRWYIDADISTSVTRTGPVESAADAGIEESREAIEIR
jgi:hypothetical protein